MRAVPRTRSFRPLLLRPAWLSALAACCACLPAIARAQEEPFTRSTGQVGGQVSYGIYVGEGDPNPYGFGLGANIGYTFGIDVHLGGRFDYYFGSSDETIVGTEVSANFFELMGVVGYDIGSSTNFVVRPQLGFGWLWTHGEVCSSSGCQDLEGDDEFVIAPGVKLLWSIVDPVYLTGEVSYNNVFSERNVDGLLFALGAGGTF